MRLRLKKTLSALIALSLSPLSGYTYAIDTDIQITGEVYIPPCKINGNNNPINVSFGKIALQNINGINYAQKKTVSIDCEYHQGKPYIVVRGAQISGADANILKTNGVNSSTLGIALYQGDSVDSAYPLKLGDGSQGDYGFEIKRGLALLNATSSQFTFTAVPHKVGNRILNAGLFTASATMSISYL